jgi:DNA-binding transcriptional ArsR family regulator
MAQHPHTLDGVFVALSDPTRRAVIQQLGRGRASVGDLAREAPAMALSSFLKHVRMLESNELIRTSKAGRVRICELNRDRLSLIDDWLSQQRQVWESRTDRLEQFVTEKDQV